jgi:hypothetical protein
MRIRIPASILALLLALLSASATAASLRLGPDCY